MKSFVNILKSSLIFTVIDGSAFCKNVQVMQHDCYNRLNYFYHYLYFYYSKPNLCKIHTGIPTKHNVLYDSSLGAAHTSHQRCAGVWSQHDTTLSDTDQFTFRHVTDQQTKPKKQNQNLPAPLTDRQLPDIPTPVGSFAPQLRTQRRPERKPGPTFPHYTYFESVTFTCVLCLF